MRRCAGQRRQIANVNKCITGGDRPDLLPPGIITHKHIITHHNVTWTHCSANHPPNTPRSTVSMVS